MTESANQANQEGGGLLRKVVLLSVLALLVVGLIYDYRVARPSVDSAYDKIIEKSSLMNMSSTNIFTNESVQELLQKAPSRTFEEDNGDFVEVYSWRSGLPFRTHDIFAVYKKSGDNWLFHRHAKFKHLSSSDISKFDGKDALQIEIAGDGPPDPMAAMAARERAAGGADGGEPGGGRGPGGGSGTRPEAETDPAASEPRDAATSEDHSNQ